MKLASLALVVFACSIAQGVSQTTPMRHTTRISILLTAVCIASTSANAQKSLSAEDSAGIALLIADHVAPSLRSANGADSTNAVCVRIEVANGIMTRVLDSALRATTGGSLLAPVSFSPLRTVAIDNFTASGDSVWVTWRTSGGGLRKGEMAWAHLVRWRLVRRDSTWTIVQPVRGTMADGFIPADLPKPPNAPGCLAKPAG